MKRRAEMVFTEWPAGGAWSGRLLNPNAIDERTGEPATTPSGRRLYVANIHESTDGFFDYMTQGAHPGSRRYGSAQTLTDAQQALSNWAKRRFYIKED